MLVNIEKEFTTVTVKDHEGILREKAISLPDLLDALSAYKSTSNGMLPRNTRMMETCGNEVALAFEFEKTNRTLTFSTNADGATTIEGCSLPAGVIFIKLIKENTGRYRHINSYIFAIRGKRISFPTDELYSYPLPNIYPDGRICWGDVSLGEIMSLSASEGILSSFFNNNFNNDLFYSRLSAECPYADKHHETKEFLQYLAMTEFLDSWLKPIHKTYGDFSSRLIRSEYV